MLLCHLLLQHLNCKKKKSFWFKHTEQFLFPFIYNDDSLQPKHHDCRLPASFNAALVIQVHSDTAGGDGVFLKGDLSPAKFADKPGHVTGERPGFGLDTGLVDVSRRTMDFHPHAALNYTKCWDLWLYVASQPQMLPCQEGWLVLQPFNRKPCVTWLKSFACYLFWLGDFQLLCVHNMEAQRRKK